MSRDRDASPAGTPSGGAAGPLWGGRFESGMAPEMVPLNLSLGVDGRLWREDVTASKAWARALTGAGVLTEAERDTLLEGLDAVAKRIHDKGLADAPEEDIHSVVERMLGEAVGSVAGKLHTGRSRNDQSSTGVRLWGMMAVDCIVDELVTLGLALHDLAARGVDVVMPGYTHLQQAQPIRAAHWALSHLFALLRDVERVRNARASTSVLPLGSGAIAGCPFPVDRDALRTELGFERVSENSLDAVSDRDWICDLLYAGAMIGVHLSRLGEDLVLFSSVEIGFVRLADGYSTGSSLMPQKRNPDVAELARGKSGRLVGNLVATLTLLKGLPTGYNRDLQEDKEALFDTFDTLLLTLPAVAGAVRTATFRPERARAVMDAQLLATDLADYLVRRGLPFRTSHEVIGRLVRRAEERGVPLSELTVEEFRAEHETFGPDVHEVFDWEASTDARDTPGGTSRRSVEAQLEEAAARLVGDAASPRSGVAPRTSRAPSEPRMASRTKGVPENSSVVIPRLVCRDPAAAVDFCTAVFDAVELGRRPGPGGEVAHALLTIGPDMLMIEAEWPSLPSRAPAADGASPVVIFVYVPDVDDVVTRGLERGAQVLVPAEDQFWGDRIAWIMDPSGHVWTVATRVEETTEAQRDERWSGILEGQAGGHDD